MEHPFEQHIFDGYERNFSTPDYHSFASELREEDRQLLPQLSDDEASTVFNYTIIWKLQLRKGRVTKLTEDTIEDVDVAPGAYFEIRTCNLPPRRLVAKSTRTGVSEMSSCDTAEDAA
jgi:hypothetical protein